MLDSRHSCLTVTEPYDYVDLDKNIFKVENPWCTYWKEILEGCGATQQPNCIIYYKLLVAPYEL